RWHGVGLESALARLAADVHLHERGHGTSERSRPLVELTCQLETIERVDEIEQLDGVPDFVGLQVTNEMPRDGSPERRYLVLGFLDAVLAEGGYAGGDGLADTVDIDRLRHADQEDVGSAPARPLRGARDPLAHALQIRADLGHGSDSSTGARASRERREAQQAAAVALAVGI